MQTVLLCLAVFVVIVGTVLVLSWYVSIHRQNVGIAHSHKKQPDFVYDTTTAEIEETREWMKKTHCGKAPSARCRPQPVREKCFEPGDADSLSTFRLTHVRQTLSKEKNHGN